MVDTEQKLAELLPQVRAAKWIALDTEADSLHAYPEKVCLIQISTATEEVLIDPLTGISLTPLLDSLAPHEIIMHGADYDLRLLRRHHRFIPQSVFDTMLAARLLGVRKFGLGDLVETYLGVKLEKGPQKANWALRPLTPRMEKYAINDTHYLKPLADKLRTDLKGKGRLSWHQESCERLIQESTVDKPADVDSVWRIKGSHLLGRPALAILRELWQWREAEAVRANKPPFFVMSHQALVDIAAAAATNRSFDHYLPRHISERRRSALTKSVARGLGIGPEQHPKILKSIGRRPSEAERRRYIEIQKKRDARAAELDIDATLIASRAVISDLAHDWEKSAAKLMKWQRALLE